MRKLTLILTLSVFLLPVAVHRNLLAQQPAKRHRIAVLQINDGAVMGSSQAVFGRQVDIGQGITDLLVDRLVSDGTYGVIERDRIDKALAEHHSLSSNLANPQTAANIGHILGVDAVIVGQVTQFGWDGQTGAPPARPLAAKGAAGLPARKAVVSITAQIIDTNTGQTLATAISKGVSRRSGTKLLDSAPSGPAGSPAMDSSSYAQSMIGEATTAAINQMAKELEGENGILPTWAPPPPRGQITDASSPNVTINVGSAAGLKVGEQMLVTRVVHVEREEGTQTPVGAVEDEVGVLTITSVQDSSATGHFSGAGAPKVGDQVRPLQ